MERMLTCEKLGVDGLGGEEARKGLRAMMGAPVEVREEIDGVFAQGGGSWR
jgi:hypothetical protein